MDEIDAKQFRDSLLFQWNRLPEATVKAQMNTGATHDSPRLLTSFANPTKYKYHAKPNENPDYVTGKPDEETYQRVKLYLIHQFTIPGAPHIWNGDEMGMWGTDDPDCRKPLWWPGLDFEPEYRNNFQPGKKEFDEVGFNREHFEFYKKIIRIRKENPVLTDGKLNFLAADKKWLAYERVLGDEQIIVVFNLGENARNFTFPENMKYTNLLEGKAVKGQEISIPPLGAGVFKKAGEE